MVYIAENDMSAIEALQAQIQYLTIEKAGLEQRNQQLEEHLKISNEMFRSLCKAVKYGDIGMIPEDL